MDEALKFKQEVVRSVIRKLFLEKPIFSVENVKVARFSSKQEVFELTLAFLNNLQQIWQTYYPDSIIEYSTSDNRSSDNIIKLRPPDDNPQFKPLSLIQNENIIKSIIDDNNVIIENQESKSIYNQMGLGNVQNDAIGNPTDDDKKVPVILKLTEVTPVDDYNASIINLTTDKNYSLQKPAFVQSQTNLPKVLPVPKVNFTVQNARVGESYKAKIREQDDHDEVIEIVDVKIPENLGISFDKDSKLLVGNPISPGEYVLNLQWCNINKSERYSGACTLIIIPDPRSLWKNFEPPVDDIYYKTNSDKSLIQSDDFKIVAASMRGRSHAHVGSFRDDDFYISNDKESGWSIIIVADGAGSAKSSRWGSRLAVNASGQHLKENLFGPFGESINQILPNWDNDNLNVTKELGTKFHYLFHEAGINAVKVIENEASLKGVPAKEYSTTLLAAAVRKIGNSLFIASFWMGDGAICVYGPKGKIRLMGTPDSGEFAGQTRFLDRAALSDQGFSNRIRIGLYQDIQSVMLMTDGVSDPRFETDNELNDPNKWDSLWDEILPHLQSESPDVNMVQWLDFLTPGHHDDRTIALLWI